ncbi:DUF438 domain-containing protein [Alkalibacter mobilis]|uniref:DUF438 domain-containing protein n=1 Tax=Alkalibacter mobilis TaxID=2787712 RepID=UPI0018A0A973|nr:DUF438 domain-containing protein [Alkalibacter mobilis]MBF7096175.1 DUF438 domain-containing protein [Alkalibacter mobilis]
MSEHINNREYRQKLLKELIMQLHDGADFDEVKKKFEENFEGVSATEITQMETQLVVEGMPVEEIQRLCDVHASVFKGTIEDIHKMTVDENTPGHPVHTFREENKLIEKLLEERIKPHIKAMEEDNDKVVVDLADDFADLWEIDKHYGRKENLLFPYMEKYDITAPPKVMWGVDDDNRKLIKDVRTILKHYQYDHPKEELIEKAKAAVTGVEEMIFKEENILFPMVIDTLKDSEWQKILEESDEYGYFFFKPDIKWEPKVDEAEQADPVSGVEGYVKFDAGFMLPEEVNAMLNTLPIDITFVDKDGRVKFFSQGKERIFARPKTIIGREVSNCHPPASVHIVEQIVEDLKTGKKDHEDFWINLGEKFVHIRYFAVRNEHGQYLGVVEVSQDIKPLKALEGEKRLAD